MNFGICLLAFGDEHIKECNHLIKSLYNINDKLNIFTYKNNSNIDFNYNLKMEAVKLGLHRYDTILFMDTDTHVNKLIDFSLLDNVIEDGFYTTTAPYMAFTHQNEVISVHSLINETEYGKRIKDVSNIHDLVFLDEQKFIIKIKNVEDRNRFYECWKLLSDNTKQFHIKNKENGLPGIYEGLIISAACKMMNLPIIHNDINTKSIFNQLSHYGWDIETPSNPSLI